MTILTTTDTADIYDGNSIVIDMEVLEAALDAIGAASLADCTTIVAEVKLVTLDSDDAATVALDTSIISDVADTRTVRAGLDDFPSVELGVPDGVRSLAARCDLRLTKGSKILTAATVDVTVRWKANT